MAVIFVEIKHILPKDITSTVEDYSFARLPEIKGGKTVREKIILSIYKDNMQIKKEVNLFTLHKVDLLLLLFLNIIGCYRQQALTFFMDDSDYENLAIEIFCYNNCLYSLNKNAKAKKVLVYLDES